MNQVMQASEKSPSTPDSQSCPPSLIFFDDPLDLQNALDIAQKAALKAGKFLARKQRDVHVLHKKSRRDDLLDADMEAEHIIISTLRARFPDHDILSEEAGIENSGSRYRWIIDPLDGSWNFQHQNPLFGISISLLIENTTVIGVIYLPRLREMFTAILEHGAWLNDELIHVSQTSDLDDAVIHVGDFAKDGDVRENRARLNDIEHLADAVGRVRMVGTAAVDLAYIACGRADALVVHNALPWDIEVGRLLVTEAGGKFNYYKDTNGNSLAICSNQNIHQALIDIINEEVSPEEGRIRQKEKPTYQPVSA